MSMSNTILPAIQQANKLYLSGPFGAGKTTLALARVRWLLQQERLRGDDILVLVPQRTLARPYHLALRGSDMPPGALPRVTTVASMVRNSVELYWPLLAPDAGFDDPSREPVFLTLETSQYHMARLVDAAIDQGEFDGVRIERSRVISQILDNLNKAALNDFSIDQAYSRLELAVPGGEQRTARLNALRTAQRISHAFRRLCLRTTLLDFSLQVHLFNHGVLENMWSRTHLFRAHRHLVFDNLEEDTRTAHQLVAQWLPQLETALLVTDEDGGYRTFLGADAAGARELAALCDRTVALTDSHVMSTELVDLTRRVNEAVLGARVARQAAARAHAAQTASEAGAPQAAARGETAPDEAVADAPSLPHDLPAAPATVIHVPATEFRFYPQMLGWVAERIRGLVEDEGVEAGTIAVLAPFVSDALRFSLQNKLAPHGIPLTTHRPSRALEDEPAARALITLAQLAHPDWGMRPPPADVTQMLTLALSGLDPVRAQLLSQIVYPPRRRTIELGRFGTLVPEMQERISFTVGERYDQLHAWLAAYRVEGEPTPLDQFFARLFGEVLSQPGYGFHQDHDAARIANQIVESARKFRWALEGTLPSRQGQPEEDLPAAPLGREYVRLFESGALGALYVPGWQEAEDAVFLAPAYTFLMRNRPVAVQFWLDIGASGWWERLYQPLTHPYVLSPRWSEHELWSDFHEFSTRQETMRHLLLGLIRRTSRAIYLGVSDYSESGFEQRGPLLNLVNRLLVQDRRTRPTSPPQE